MAARILVIGLDAFEHTLLLDWARAGKLTTFSKLLATSRWGITQGPAGLYAGAVWPSFNTGADPSNHRRFFRRQAPLGAYLDAEFTPHQIAGTPFWETLSAAGRRVAVLDVPHTRLSRGLNGIQLIDWASHEPELEQAASFPSTLRGEIIERFGLEPPDACEQTSADPASHRALVRHLERRIQSKLAMSRHYLTTQSWDLFITVFGESHCAGHQWWHLHDRSHPRYDAALVAATGDLLEQTYVALDAAVGELIAAAGPETMIMVVAVHGMGPLYGESVVLDEILRRLEAPAAASPSAFTRLKRAWYRLPPALRSLPVAKSLKARLQPSLHRSLLLPDRHARRYFAIPYNPHGGAIRINVAGREERGLVQPGEEYRSVCEMLRRELESLTCADSGRAVAEGVYLPSQTYDGPFAPELPDVVVQWNRHAPVRRITSPRVGTIDIPVLGGRTGDHTRGGIFFASGRGVSAGRIERPLSVLDYAPTFCALLQVESPRLPGNTIEELIDGSAAINAVA